MKRRIKTFFLFAFLLLSTSIGQTARAQNAERSDKSVVTVSKDVILLETSMDGLPGWCPSRAFYGPSGTGFMKPENLENEHLGVQHYHTGGPNESSLALKAGQKLRVLSSSHGNKLETVGSMGECGRYYFMEMEVLNDQEQSTGGKFILVAFGPSKIIDNLRFSFFGI